MVVRRFEVWLVVLDPTVGREMQKTRPCVVVSPDEMNSTLGVVIAAPLTSTVRAFPFRYNTVFKRKSGQVALDQIRSLDKTRLIKKLGSLNSTDSEAICEVLTAIFSFE